MTGQYRESERRLIDEEARAYRESVKQAKREFADNLAKERAILDEAELVHGDQFKREIEDARTGLDRAEREFIADSDRALRAFNSSVRGARRSIG